VRKAVENVNGPIAEELRGADARDQAMIDRILIELDGTADKSRLGANALLGVSVACAKAAAAASGLALYRYLGGAGASLLPVPMMNVVNGGAHADNRLDPQEFMICPVGFVSFAEALRAGAETFHALKAILKKKGLSTGVGGRGRLRAGSPRRGRYRADRPAIASAGTAPEATGHRARSGGFGVLREEEIPPRGRRKDALTSGMIDYWESLVADFPIVSIEDGLAEGDWEGWKEMTRRLGGKILIVGDDVFVTNPKIVSRGIAEGVGNAVLVKLNQIGTLSETLETVSLAQKSRYATIISHRSGETDDDTIADLAVACGTGLIKTGSASRGERLSKYNRLLRIEDDLAPAGRFAGSGAFRR
jgi:enolase